MAEVHRADSRPDRVAKRFADRLHDPLDGLPIHWRTRIIDWQPPTQFIDLQIRGPYRLWHHHHTFTATSEGTECTDRVLYALPFPPLDRLAHAISVRRQLLGIFGYRRTIIGKDLGWVRAVQPEVRIVRV